MLNILHTFHPLLRVQLLWWPRVAASGPLCLPRLHAAAAVDSVARVVVGGEEQRQGWRR